MELNIYIPKNKTIYLDAGVTELIEYADTREYYEYEELAGKKLVMKEKGLELQE